MARIRSIHPGFATDEDLVSVSFAARLFYLMLLTECDDQGIFEWKIITLKMRLFPADNIDIPPLLEELAAVRKLRGYEVNGHRYGVIRNFRRFQRPKSPNSTYPKPDDWGKYVGLDSAISEITDDEDTTIPPSLPESTHVTTANSPIASGIRPQMEEGGDKMEEIKGKGSSPDDPKPAARGSRLAPDWQPSPEDRQFATDWGVNPDREADNFRDYWRGVAGAKGIKLDWSATWRNSVRRVGIEPAASPVLPAEQKPLESRDAHGLSRGDYERAYRFWVECPTDEARMDTWPGNYGPFPFHERCRVPREIRDAVDSELSPIFMIGR